MKQNKKIKFKPELNIFEMDRIFSDPLRSTGGLTLVNGDAQIDVARFVVRRLGSRLPGKRRSGLQKDERQ